MWHERRYVHLFVTRNVSNSANRLGENARSASARYGFCDAHSCDFFIISIDASKLLVIARSPFRWIGGVVWAQSGFCWKRCFLISMLIRLYLEQTCSKELPLQTEMRASWHGIAANIFSFFTIYDKAQDPKFARVFCCKTHSSKMSYKAE